MIFNFLFKGKNDEEIMDSILEDERNEYNFHYSNDFKDLINKMISKEPEKRPSPTEILGMQFIKKRMESYLNENNCQFLKAQNTFGLFDDLEEIESESELLDIKESNKKDKINDSNKKDNEDNKKIEKKDDDKREEKKIKDNKEVEKEKKNEKKSKKFVRFIIEDIIDDNKDDNKNKYKKQKPKNVPILIH